MKTPNILHSRRDQLLTQSLLIPQNATPVKTDPIDLGQTGGIDQAMIWLIIPPLTKLASGKKVSITLQASPTPHDADFTPLAEIPVITATGAESGGSEQIQARYRIPVDVPRYIRASAQADASPGAIGDQSLELSVRL